MYTHLFDRAEHRIGKNHRKKLKSFSFAVGFFFWKTRIQILLPVWEVMSDLILISLRLQRTLTWRTALIHFTWLKRNVLMNHRQNFFSPRAFIRDSTATSWSAFAEAHQESDDRIRAWGVEAAGPEFVVLLLQASFFFGFFYNSRSLWIFWFDVSMLQNCNLSCSGDFSRGFWAA